MTCQFWNKGGKNKGFTLIELLIVVAIILILIAIALPNFLEAQIRARVAKAKSELKSLYVAMEEYYLDFKTYPEECEAHIVSTNEGTGLLWLTSPIKYISSVPSDPFVALTEDDIRGAGIVVYEMGGIEEGARRLDCQSRNRPDRGVCLATWVMWSKGPDRDEPHGQEISGENAHYYGIYRNYSPTNGTASRGNIFQWGGDPYWVGVQLGDLSNLATYKANQATYDVGIYVDGDLNTFNSGEKFLHRFPTSLK